MENVDQNMHYGSSIEHVYDELLYVDLLLNAEVLYFREQNPQIPQFNPLQGLYITDQEVDRLIDGKYKGYEWVRNDIDINSDYGKLHRAADVQRQKIDEKVKKSIDKGTTLKIVELQKMFNCSKLETAVIVVCMAPEIDQKYRKIYAYLQNDATRKHPSVDLVLNLCCKSYEEKIAARSSFSAQAPLFKHHLIKFINNTYDKNRPLPARDLRVDDRITGFLLDSPLIDDTIAKVARFHETKATFDELILPSETKEKFRKFAEFYKQDNSRETPYIISLTGAYGPEKQEAAAIMCNSINVPLLTIDIESAFNHDEMFETILDLAIRESVLVPAALYFINCDFLFNQDDEKNYFLRRYFVEVLEKYSWLTFIDSEKPVNLHGEFNIQVFLELTFPLPDYAKRMELWRHYIGAVDNAENYDIPELSSKFSLNSEQIQKAVITGNTIAMWRSPMDVSMKIDDLYESCHIHSSQRLGNLAHKIRPRYSWNDVILPADNKQLLQDLVKNVRFKHMVYDTWGFNKKLSIGKGINALFWGSPGTGKTMCADIIANELSMELYKIDLSTIVSKYIGETEKNLDRIFNEAERSNAILFFDEADALFGKRSEVKDSHDRYANIEVGYLLQRMEEYSGVVILSSNLKKNMDDAFTRRLQYIVHFPFPDEVSRLDIWKKIFPGEAPVDNNIDYGFLAKWLKIAGGNIKNIALGAAFFAAEKEKKITMDHILDASKREFHKIRRPLEYEDIVKKLEKAV